MRNFTSLGRFNTVFPIIKSGPAFEPESIYKVAFVRRQKPLLVVDATLDHGIDFIRYNGKTDVTKNAVFTGARFMKDGKVFYVHKYPICVIAYPRDIIKTHLTQKKE